MPAYRKVLKDAYLTLPELATRVLDALLLLHFTIKGKTPCIRGYDVFKRQTVKRALSSSHFSTSELPPHFGNLVDERIIEYPWFFSRLPAALPGNLLDAGSVLNFDYIINHRSIKNKKLFISTLAPELHSFWDQGISYLYDDIRSTCFRSDYFNWIVSLSTLEHVGMDNTTYYTSDSSKRESSEKDYLEVISEYHRILKPGGTCYLSVPFGAKKHHQWLQVFDQSMVEEIIKTFGPASFSVHYFRYTPHQGWAASTAEKCADAIYHDYHVDGCSRDKPAAAEAVVCIEMQKQL